MAEDLAFDTERCPVDPVTRIPPCDNLLRDPRVSDPPDPITDCDPVPLTLPPEPPCPDIEIAEVVFEYGGKPQFNPAELRFELEEGSCCDFDFVLDLSIPCPVIQPDEENPVAEQPPFTDGPNLLTYQVVNPPNLPTGSCDFELQIALELHCVQLTPSAAAPAVKPIPGGGTLTYGFARSAPDECDWELDIDVDLSGVCPQITNTVNVAVTTLPSGTPATGSASVTVIDCENWDWDFSFGIPEGPEGPEGPQGPPGNNGFVATGPNAAALTNAVYCARTNSIVLYWMIPNGTIVCTPLAIGACCPDYSSGDDIDDCDFGTFQINAAGEYASVECTSGGVPQTIISNTDEFGVTTYYDEDNHVVTPYSDICCKQDSVVPTCPGEIALVGTFSFPDTACPDVVVNFAVDGPGVWTGGGAVIGACICLTATSNTETWTPTLNCSGAGSWQLLGGAPTNDLVVTNVTVVSNSPVHVIFTGVITCASDSPPTQVNFVMDLTE